MSGLELATLQRMKGLERAGKQSKATPKADGNPIPVQFNPASLKISRRNNVEAIKRGRTNIPSRGAGGGTYAIAAHSLKNVSVTGCHEP